MIEVPLPPQPVKLTARSPIMRIDRVSVRRMAASSKVASRRSTRGIKRTSEASRQISKARARVGHPQWFSGFL